MDIRYSSSLIKVYKSCPFRFYCKVTNQEKDPSTDMSFANAGNVVHETLEYYFKNLHAIPKDSAILELKSFFESTWESVDTTNKYITKDIYWSCVINGINLDIKPSHLEYEFRINRDGINFIGYADVMNTTEHWIGDWKTSTYKKAKVEMYKSQLKHYGWAYWKEFGVIPKAWVYFNKADKKFDFIFTSEDMEEVSKEMISITHHAKKRLEELRFERKPERGSCYFCPYKNLCSTDLLKNVNTEKFEVTFHLKKNKLLIEGAIPDEVHKQIEAQTNFELKNAHFIKKAMLAKGVVYDAIKRLYKRKDYGAETFIGFMHTAYEILKTHAHGKGKKIRLTVKDYRKKIIAPVKYEKLIIPFEMYEFQTAAVRALMHHKWGIVEVGTGGGKTVIAAEAIRQLGMKTLFIIDNKDLLLQTKKEYETMLNVKCGVVGMGKREWDYPIVLATIQTLSKNVKAFAPQLLKFPLVVYDETHIIASKSFEIVSKYLENTKYRFGFCLDSMTQILTPYKKKRLGSLKIGDEVLSFNHTTKKIEIDTVKNIFDKKVNEFFYIRVQTLKGIRTIKSSMDHKFYTSRGYIKAKDLTENDEIYCENADYIFRLMHKYYLEGKTLNEVAIKYNYDVKTIRRKFHSLKLKVRDASEAHEGIPACNKGSNPNRIQVRFPGYKRSRRLKINSCEKDKKVFCEYCSEVIKENFIECHHKDRNRKNNKLSNLLILHNYCHSKLHYLNEGY